ncbi:LOW QUALITY PROTEIN: hypothetical protein V1478_007426 [Vespula squamosa]|uniref:Uncharacterized protein n=1 Tax=Vespula squamosa TaxID=30214 RepID=A0ABD2B375_VESSQ
MSRMKIYLDASAAKAATATATVRAAIATAITTATSTSNSSNTAAAAAAAAAAIAATALTSSSIRLRGYPSLEGARKSGRISKKVGFVETNLKEDEEDEEEEKMEGKRRPEEGRNYPREKPNVRSCGVLSCVGLCYRFLSRFKLQPGRWLAPRPSGPFVSGSSSSFPKERDTPVSESSLEGLKIKDTKRYIRLLERNKVDRNEIELEYERK